MLPWALTARVHQDSVLVTIDTTGHRFAGAGATAMTIRTPFSGGGGAGAVDKEERKEALLIDL